MSPSIRNPDHGKEPHIDSPIDPVVFFCNRITTEEGIREKVEPEGSLSVLFLAYCLTFCKTENHVLSYEKCFGARDESELG